jgi:hypothetical protein
MDVFFQMPSFVTILDFVGTFAFAISGIRLASAKRFDWFGAYVVGLATAIGGGTIRDVLLDVTPAWMTDPMYLICTAFAMFFVILFGKYVIRLNNTFFIFDTIGLALFTVVGFEVYFTVLIELIWDKERIMEVYLNSIEMGDGIYGAEAVAKAHFHTTASQLTRKQCALIAASLPNPRKYNSGKPSPYMYKRQRKIMYLMKCVPTFPEKAEK